MGVNVGYTVPEDLVVHVAGRECFAKKSRRRLHLEPELSTLIGRKIDEIRNVPSSKDDNAVPESGALALEVRVGGRPAEKANTAMKKLRTPVVAEGASFSATSRVPVVRPVGHIDARSRAAQRIRR